MNQVTLQTTEQEERLARRVNSDVANSLTISDHAGGLAFANVEQVMEVAKLMAVSQVAVPKHLRGNPGACIAVCIQAIEWRMSPFAVANKSYSVNDRMAYEAQLIQAVILQRAPIEGRIKVEYIGEGDKRRCRVWAVLAGEAGEIVEYLSPEFIRIQPKNSPLWKTDPDQQQFYSAVRALCRRHFPDVLLGVYAKDEIEDAPIGPDNARDVTPARPPLSSRLKTADGRIAGFSKEFVDSETGEVLDQPVEDFDQSAGAPEDALDDPSSTYIDDDLPGEETLLDAGRTIAMQGSGALLKWRNGLTDEEKAEIKPHLEELKAAAKRADGGANG